MTFSGFVDVIRDHKKHLFFVIRDRTDMVQVFADKALFPDTHITTESFVRISGHIESRPEVRLHGFEIVATQIEILSVPEEDLPISWKSE
ncbi:MAG TPA: OB-fold nucleic acid binding domain-containing protein [bacterium]|nr:OB-fold nucleic acid binding domain-containing protein [bacterium]